jgi:hypothetical protein
MAGRSLRGMYSQTRHWPDVGGGRTGRGTFMLAIYMRDLGEVLDHERACDGTPARPRH